MYVCRNCGYAAAKWSGKCPNCGEWGTLDESNMPVKKKAGKVLQPVYGADLVKAATIPESKLEKLSTGFTEIDRILGGGIARGAVTLVGGDPGIGKSTLLLQVLAYIASEGHTVAYISGEESLAQLSSRLKRLLSKIPDTLLMGTDTDLESVVGSLSRQKLDFVVIDSIHSLTDANTEGTYGGISQLKMVTSSLTQWAKKNDTGMFLVGQVTKEGYVAGPKNVEHIVDTVMYIERLGDENIRLVRTVKNRFGEVGEVGFLKMAGKGLEDKTDFSRMLVEESAVSLPGGALGITLQGSRPIMVHLQVLTNDTMFAVPRRVVDGISKNKVEVLAAVIAKKLPKLYLDKKDIFIKANGGISLKDPGIDLAIIGAILSSVLNVSFETTVFIGEVGLQGEIKACAGFDARLKEAKKLGFTNIVTYKTVSHISEILEFLKKKVS
ncbi:MAG: DNA repair protein RadA [Candidatus Dojkabacteria bacterium]|nr:MAG: DNA repair protein RadA [Candidatus Dojkabacteria bacterium]